MADENEKEPKTQEPSCEPDETPGAASEAKAPPAAAEPVDVEALKAKAKERDEFLDLAQRTRAELINYRKRVDRERAEWTERVVGEFMLTLLPALDDLDRALKEAEGAADVKTLLAGFRQIDQKFHDILKSQGLEPFKPHGKPFDPVEHEAVVIEESDKHPHQAVSGVVRKGWKLRGKLLRPAQVKVTMKPEAKSDEPKPSDATPAPDKKEPKNDADV